MKRYTSIFIFLVVGVFFSATVLAQEETPTFPNDTGLYTTVNAAEHADDGRSHVFEYAIFGGSLDEDVTNTVVVRTAPGFYPGAYNVVTRNENEIFVYYGVYGEVESVTGPAVARLDGYLLVAMNDENALYTDPVNGNYGQYAPNCMVPLSLHLW